MSRAYRTTALFFFVLFLAAIWLVYPAGVPILAYHMVSDEPEIYSVDSRDFETQMSYLAAQGYTAISLAELFDATGGKARLPAKPVVITFDDGYEDNYSQALPIMEKYGMKATVFVIAGSVGQPGYLSWQQIQEMHNRHTEIGSHTMTHMALNELSPAERRQEIVDSKILLEQHLGTPVEFLAYPYGQFDTAIQEILREAGYRGACSGIAGFNLKGGNAYALKWVNIPRPQYGLWEFRLRLLRANVYSKLGI